MERGQVVFARDPGQCLRRPLLQGSLLESSRAVAEHIAWSKTVTNLLEVTVSHLGLIERMPAAQYFAIEALSNSGISTLMERSPRHYKLSFTEEARAHAREPSPQMLNGTLTHVAVLEPDELTRRYVVGPDVDKRSKEWKTFTAKAKDMGLEVITQLEREVAFEQAAAVRSVPLIADLLADGKPEVSCFWHEEVSLDGIKVKILCKARIDWVHMVGTDEEPAAVLFDLKTSGNAARSAFERSVANYNYHRQAMWYSRGFEAATGIKVVGFVFGVVESSWPFAATPCMIDDLAMERGQQECQDALQLAARCQYRNEWPGYPQDIQILSLPPWKLKEITA